MGKHAQLVIGPAGSGKSTYCRSIQEHCDTIRRTVHVVNLDPAAEDFGYNVSIDIRDLISLSDVMEELDYGPNGGLVYCMEYLVQNMDWLSDQIEDFGEDYLLFDCPGQIELYTHLPVMQIITRQLADWGYQTCAVYLIDSLVIGDANRFISGTLMCLAAMVQLELPHVNVLTKCDMVEDKEALEQFCEPDARYLAEEMGKTAHGRHLQGLNSAIGRLIEEYSMVSFCPLDITDEDSISTVLSYIDNAIQYGEDLEPREPRDPEDADADADASQQED